MFPRYRGDENAMRAVKGRWQNPFTYDILQQLRGLSHTWTAETLTSSPHINTTGNKGHD